MKNSLSNAGELVRKVYVLARPYGRKRLALVTGAALAQGVFSVLGVTSIFPFLALAADPGRLRNSNFGRKFLEWLPPMDNGQLLLFAGLFAIAMMVLSNAVNLGAEFVRTRYAYGFSHWLRVGLLRRVASQPYGYFLRENTAVLMKRVTGDVILYSHSVLLPLLDCFARLTTILFLLVALFLVHPQVALGAAAVIGVFYLLVFRMLKNWRARVNEASREATMGLGVECRKLLDGIKAVKVHGAEEAFLDTFAAHSAKQARFAAQVPVVAATPRYLIEPLALGGLVVVVLVYAARGLDLLTILPNLGVMALAAYRLLPTFQLLYGQLTQLTTNRYALDEVYKEVAAAEQIVVAKSPAQEARLARQLALPWSREIRFDNLRFCYPGTKRPVIEGMNLVIPKNSSVGIVGETGSGKSTLVDLVLGLHVPTSGRILVDDLPLGPEHHRSWRAGIGYVPQDIFLIDESITANIAFGIPPREVDHDAVREAARAAQILDFVENDLPQGFATPVGERGVRLSGGQRQRIGLARALYHRPSLLILDEATSALDVATEEEVMKAIKQLQGQVTMLVIAHRLSTLEGCDRIIDLSGGRREILADR